MKRSIFSKVIFCLVLAISISSLGSVSAETLLSIPPEISSVPGAAIPALALAAVAIPAYNLENLKCVTKEAFESLKAKYGKIYVVDVIIDEDEKYQFIVRRLTRDVQNLIEKYADDPSKISDLIIKNLVIAGNENNALDDGIVFKQFSQAIIPIMSAGQSFFGKA